MDAVECLDPYSPGSGGDVYSGKAACKWLLVNVGMIKRAFAEFIAMSIKHAPCVRIVIPAGIGMAQSYIETAIQRFAVGSGVLNLDFISSYGERTQARNKRNNEVMASPSLARGDVLIARGR